jgi:hypothetical protein
VPGGVERFVEIVRIDVPEPPETRETLVGLRETAGPLRTVRETVALRLTVPVKPPKLVSVAVKVALDPLVTDCELGFATIEKSGGCCGFTFRVTPAAVCERLQAEQEAPDANIAYLPVGVELVVATVSVDVACDPLVGRLTIVGLSDAAGPCATLGEMESVRLTMPVKPFMLVIVTVKLVDEPAVIVWEVGVVAIEKSPVVKVAP